MIMKYSFFSLIFFGFISNTISQQLVVDPVVVSTLVYTHTEQQSVLKDIKSSEDKIRNFQLLISYKMEQIKGMQQKSYEYLSKVNSVVKNGKDVIYASKLVADISKYQKQSMEYAANDPKLLIVAAKTEYELVSRSLDLTFYIYNLALKGGDNNMLDNKQRIDMVIHVVAELKRMRTLAYTVSRQIRFAQRNGLAKALAPEQFRYINRGKYLSNRILKDLTYIKKGGKY